MIVSASIKLAQVRWWAAGAIAVRVFNRSPGQRRPDAVLVLRKLAPIRILAPVRYISLWRQYALNTHGPHWDQYFCFQSYNVNGAYPVQGGSGMFDKKFSWAVRWPTKKTLEFFRANPWFQEATRLHRLALETARETRCTWSLRDRQHPSQHMWRSPARPAPCPRAEPRGCPWGPERRHRCTCAAEIKRCFSSV